MVSKNQLVEEVRNKLLISENEALKVIDNIVIINQGLDSKDLVRINPTTHKAETVKLKNLTINLKKAMIDSAEMGLVIFGVAAVHWLIPVAAIIAVNKMWSDMQIDIHPMLATVLQAMWENPKNESLIQSQNEALALVNKKLVLLNQPQISVEEIQQLLSQLELLKIIERKDNLIFLRETITFDSEF